MQQIALIRLYTTRIIALLGSVVALTAFIYGALLLGAVTHTAVQTKAQREVGTLAAEVSTLEAQYFAIIRSITPERARDMGFEAPKVSFAIFKTAASDVLTLQGFSGL